MDKLRIYHVGKRSGEWHEGVMTVATEVQDDNTLRVGVAFCSPADKFVKAIGRTKAVGRMKSRSAEIIPFSGHSSDDIVDLINNHDEFHTTTGNLDDVVEKPHIWMNRKLVSNATTGLSFVINND
jgi:hypothetical protein